MCWEERDGAGGWSGQGELTKTATVGLQRLPRRICGQSVDHLTSLALMRHPCHQP